MISQRSSYKKENTCGRILDTCADLQPLSAVFQFVRNIAKSENYVIASTSRHRLRNIGASSLMMENLHHDYPRSFYLFELLE